MSNPNQARKNAARRRQHGGSYQATTRTAQKPPTRWIEDPSLEAPEGHQWMRPAPDDCPNCPCHTLRVCETLAWHRADPPTYPDGTEYDKPCPCETREEEREVSATVCVDGAEYVVSATFRLGGLVTERIWEGVIADPDGTTAPIPLAMVLLHPDIGGRGDTAVDNLGREWIQHPYASHGGLTYLITGLHPEAERDRP